MSTPRVDDGDMDEAARRLDLAVGEVIRLTRTGRRWSQDDLAAAAGPSKKTIGRVERGTASSQIPVLFKLAAALDMTLSELTEKAEQLVAKGFGA